MRSLSSFVMALLAAAALPTATAGGGIFSSSSQTQKQQPRRLKAVGTGSSIDNHDGTPLFQWSQQLRGGATTTSTAAASCCADSDLQLALKAGVSTAAETGGLWLLLWGTDKMARSARTPHWLRQPVHGLPVMQWIALVWTIFASSAVKSLVDGGVVSVASNQALQPSTIPGNSEAWYLSLQKPWFNPPGWLFPIMWLIVSKPTQLWGVSRILKLAQSSAESPIPAAVATTKHIWLAMAVYCGHLALGDSWNQVFFGCQRIRLGAQVICIFWSMLAVTAALFGRLDPRAGQLLLPTLGWVTVAAALNLEIFRLSK